MPHHACAGEGQTRSTLANLLRVMSDTIAHIGSKAEFNAWKKAALSNVWTEVVSDSDSMDNDYAKKSMDRLTLSPAASFPFLIVYRWIRTNEGPYLHYTLIQPSRFPHFAEVTSELAQLRAYIKNVKEFINNEPL